MWMDDFKVMEVRALLVIGAHGVQSKRERPRKPRDLPLLSSGRWRLL